MCRHSEGVRKAGAVCRNSEGVRKDGAVCVDTVRV